MNKTTNLMGFFILVTNNDLFFISKLVKDAGKYLIPYAYYPDFQQYHF